MKTYRILCKRECHEELWFKGVLVYVHRRCLDQAYTDTYTGRNLPKEESI